MAMTLDEMRELALLRLHESGYHEEQWDLLFATPGSQEIVYISHDRVAGWAFEPEDWGWYGIGEDRQVAISEGGCPTDAEVQRWRLARAMEAIASLDSDCSHAFIVPVCDRMVVQGYAVFDAGLMDNHPDSEPSLLDVFVDGQSAHAAVRGLGVIKGAGKVT